MTYFGVLLRFVVPAVILLTMLEFTINRPRRGPVKGTEGSSHAYWIVAVHVLLALLYTTPWDNYLVATSVWWYDSALVTGLFLGYVPIEEYTFFIAQTLLAGFWILLLMRSGLSHWPAPVTPRRKLRIGLTLVAGVVWLASAIILSAGWQGGTYLALILVWALPPMMLQFAFGADILLANWRLILPAVLVPTIYLWVVDYLAINSGTWTISPDQTTGIALGVLPIEEMLFFLVTNLLVGLGIPLMLHSTSRLRAQEWRKRLSGGYRQTDHETTHAAE